ncbi:MAG: enoyl-CoA hydratase/isomerase family protein [Archaeoglobaceae archaeon]|nr:enoyl-CoA hydratase/isomerase family protein [Archaeoglobaceae archaeon]MCX8152491.1 enoyl-CoA hydratase/isomerase family protein [Archaeoglobaceae archaeon]MDW8013694.1 enoyl-CoA hydratase/isomerase family protein [Archaeoglobaceae archaeon]
MEKVKVVLGDVARIVLNRPEKKNALDLQMLSELRKAVDLVKRSGSKILVLSGEGDTFCSGLDRNLLLSLIQREVDEEIEKAIDFVQKIVYDLRNIEIPTIAAVKRYAIGAGFQLALAADLRLSTPGTIFCIKEPEFGIIPDMGALYLLPRIVGDGVAKDLVFSRKELKAEEAKNFGLVNEVCEDLERSVEDYTKKLLSVPIHTLKEAKKLIEKSWNQNFLKNLKETKRSQIRCLIKMRRIQKI